MDSAPRQLFTALQAHAEVFLSKNEAPFWVTVCFAWKVLIYSTVHNDILQTLCTLYILYILCNTNWTHCTCFTDCTHCTHCTYYSVRNVHDAHTAHSMYTAYQNCVQALLCFAVWYALLRRCAIFDHIVDIYAEVLSAPEGDNNEGNGILGSDLFYDT